MRTKNSIHLSSPDLEIIEEIRRGMKTPSGRRYSSSKIVGEILRVLSLLPTKEKTLMLREIRKTLFKTLRNNL
jgi:hypothetical protein